MGSGIAEAGPRSRRSRWFDRRRRAESRSSSGSADPDEALSYGSPIYDLGRPCHEDVEFDAMRAAARADPSSPWRSAPGSSQSIARRRRRGVGVDESRGCSPSRASTETARVYRSSLACGRRPAPPPSRACRARHDPFRSLLHMPYARRSSSLRARWLSSQEAIRLHVFTRARGHRGDRRLWLERIAHFERADGTSGPDARLSVGAHDHAATMELPWRSAPGGTR